MILEQTSVVHTYEFDERLSFSKGQRRESDHETIRQMLAGCVSVVDAGIDEDRSGTDYVAVLRGGRRVPIDAKARERGCSRYWKNGPELALELWSVKPTQHQRGVVGWTLDESKTTELVLFTFDPVDCSTCFLVCFQLLRVAFRKRCNEWMRSYFCPDQRTQTRTAEWLSQCVFVPVDVVLREVANVGVYQPRLMA